MGDLNEIGRPYYLSTEEVICGHLEDFSNITRDFFNNLAKCYSQRGRGQNTEGLTKLSDELIDKSEQLKSSVKTALKQIEIHKEINKLKEEIAKEEKDILQVHIQLKEAENVLSTAVFQAKKKLKAMEQAKTASVSCEELIKFAFRISSGNSVEAPIDWVPGDPRRPYPLDIEMRCGALGLLSQKGPATTTEDDVGSSEMETNNKAESKNDKTAEDLTNGKHSLDATPNNSTSSSRNGGIWQGPPSEDVAHLAIMPGAALMSSSNGVNTEEVEFMSSSSDSSSSADSS